MLLQKEMFLTSLIQDDRGFEQGHCVQWKASLYNYPLRQVCRVLRGGGHPPKDLSIYI